MSADSHKVKLQRINNENYIFYFLYFQSSKTLSCAILAVQIEGLYTGEQHSIIATERILGHVTSNI